MARFSAMVMTAQMLSCGSWAMRPMAAARRQTGSGVMSPPSSSTLPLSGTTRPVMTRSNVDLPAPLEPITVMKSPSSTSRLTPASALISLAEPLRKVFTRSRRISTGSPAEDAGTQLRHREGAQQERRRDQAEVDRLEPDPQGQRHQQAIDQDADHRRDHPALDRAVAE